MIDIKGIPTPSYKLYPVFILLQKMSNPLLGSVLIWIKEWYRN